MAALSLIFDLIARDRASREFDHVGDSAEDAGERGRRAGAAIGAGLAVMAAAAVKFGADSVQAYSESEQSSARLDAALAKFPKTADVSRAALDDLNASLAAKTVYDDDATASGQAVLAGFNLTGQQITQLTPLLQDYATKTGKDLPTAARDLGKAINGQGTALKKVGVNFKDAGSTGANFDQVMTGLRAKVGGFAEVEGQTAAGQAAILSNRFGEVQEKVGAKLVPALTSLAASLVVVIEFLDRNSAIVGPLAVGFGALAAVVLTVNAATAAAAAVQAAYATVVALVNGNLAILTIRFYAYEAGLLVVAAAQKVMAVGTALLNAVLLANPIGLVVAAIALLVGAFILAYKKSDTFRAIVQAAFEGIKTVAVKAISALLTYIGALVEGFAKMLSALGHVPGFGWAKDAAAAVRGAKDELYRMRDAINAVPDNSNKTITFTTIRQTVFRGGKVVNGGGGIPEFAAAGGWIRGAGTSTSDSIPTMLSNGEFVVNAAAARANAAVLEGINTGLRLPTGTSVVPARAPAAAGLSGAGRTTTVVVRAETDDSVARAVARRVETTLRDHSAVYGIGALL